ncbi:MAG TPA: 16S rRNA (cytosine(967)-C(5))-methyltransferase RsmB [Vicinamibacterales bacterium]|nr:16S rRNA (cytosine(967)-C(5))-methyltransferase RsmB [Vicinamibacterales bacterium]
MTPARLAAARVLIAVERGRTSLAAEVERARTDVAESRERGLLLEIAAGVLRWQRALDVCLTACSKRPIADLEPGVRAVLRSGAYQLLHLDRIPAHAVVHEAVNTVRVLGQARAAGFVNAVLRALTRKRDSMLPSRTHPLAYLGVTLSHPDWLVARWLDRYGFDATEAWCKFNNESADVAVRPVPGLSVDALMAKLATAGIGAHRGVLVADCLRLPAGSLGRLDSETRASLIIQEEASQLVAHSVAAGPDERVLDVCAAPGGKSVVMAHGMEGRGLLVSADLRPNRVAMLKATIARFDVHARVVAADAMAPLPFGAAFDRVLIDVPCSGLGTLRRDPDLKWSRTEADLPRLAADAGRMLAHAADAVREGGLLVYATCSSEPEENEAVVAAFLQDRPQFTLERPAPVASVPALDRVIDPAGYLRTLPFRDGLDAFFAAALRHRAPAGL